MMLTGKLAVSFASLVLCFACLVSALDPRFYAEPFDEGVCPTGQSQSPINIVTKSTSRLPKAKRSTLVFPKVNDVVVINKGTALQVEWASLATPGKLPILPVGGKSISDVLSRNVKVTGSVKVQPINLHFHSVSEHSVDGCLGAVEAHIVSLVAKGEKPEWGCDAFWNGGEPNYEDCAAVFAVIYKIGSSSPAYLDNFFNAASRVENESVDYAASFDLASVVPKKSGYWTYSGSLTTPDCTEGVRWTVFKDTVPVTSETMAKIQYFMADTQDAEDPTITNDYRTNNRFPQPLNGRTVYSVHV